MRFADTCPKRTIDSLQRSKVRGMGRHSKSVITFAGTRKRAVSAEGSSGFTRAIRSTRVIRRHASADAPQYEIQSDKTDHVAMHKGSALRKID
jgi:hypothetical protein